MIVHYLGDIVSLIEIIIDAGYEPDRSHDLWSYRPHALPLHMYIFIYIVYIFLI